MKFVNKCGCIVDYELLSRAIYYGFSNLKKRKRNRWKIVPIAYGDRIVPTINVTINGLNRRYLISRLIAKYLWGKAVDGNVIHHIDHNPKNNAVENLEIMSLAEHTSLHKKGYRCQPYDKEKDETILLYQEGYTLKQLGEKYGCSQKTIRQRFMKWHIPRRQHPKQKLQPILEEGR